MNTDAERIRQALSFVPANDRELWWRMAMAVKSELGDGGFGVWNEWSQQDHAYKERDARAVWKGIRTAGGVSIGSLYYLAQSYGWQPETERKVDAATEARQRRERAAQRAAEEAEAQALRAACQRSAAALAAVIWRTGLPAGSDHPYLQRKRVPALGLRRIAARRVLQPWRDLKRALAQEPTAPRLLESDTTLLLVPLRDTDGNLSSLQFIGPAGEKLFLVGGQPSGRYHAIAGNGRRLVVCEGYATGAAIHTATGDDVAVAFNAGNLGPAAQALRAKFPGRFMLIAGDDDRWTACNPGVRKAREAARSACARWCRPAFADLDGRPTDFNDLWIREGAEVVRSQIVASDPLSMVSTAADVEGLLPVLAALPDDLAAVQARAWEVL